MVVRLLTSIAGRDFAYAAGDLFDCDEATAARLVAGGSAEPVSPVARVASAPETAMRLKARGRA